MDGERRRLIEAYWAHYRAVHVRTGEELTRPSSRPAQHLERGVDDDHTWSCDVVADAVATAPSAVVVALLEDLLSSPEADAVYLGAGPLEDLLHSRPAISGAIAERCRRSDAAAQWHEALSTVIWSDHHRAELAPLSPWLRQRRSAPP